jgi:sulfite reductase (NADPH) flavoprotein alpha-component
MHDTRGQGEGTTHQLGEPIPSRACLEAAEQHNDSVGHEIDGFLSASLGFIPKRPPVLAFPASHAAWDDIVARMPELWRTVSVRRALGELPVLDAGPDALPDEYVWRASTALSIFAHSYVRSEKLPAGELPRSISMPWETISNRMKRRAAHMSYNDLIIYNHRILDRSLSNPHVVENMELLVPTVDNAEEHHFYLVQVEILARGTPIVTSAIRAQEAVMRGDDDALEKELLLMLQTWRDITELSFRKADPNPLSSTYVDQVVFANVVAPLAVPLREWTAGPGGAASPIFHLMDAFLGRKFKDSDLGKEVARYREWFPPHHMAFLDAVERISVADHIAGTGNRHLQALWDTLFEAYAGEKGYLGTHRLKVYGYLELAFKVGRSVTIAHIEGAFKDRQWKAVDTLLEDSRSERYMQLPPHLQYARIKSREPAAKSGGVRRIVLDLSETGGVYRPGDRCGVLSMSSPAAVEGTLDALRATGDEAIPLNQRWRHAIRYRKYPPGTRTLPLREFLTYAKLRPVSRSVAKALYAISSSRGLHAVIEGHLEGQWELADVLRLMRREGYDTRRLVEAGLEQQEALARIVSPQDFRMYSVASPPDRAGNETSDELHLAVAQLRYPADIGIGGGNASELRGTASSYLTETASGESFPIQLSRPSRFALPRDPSRPIVMFAGGVGVAPFLGFIAQRSRDACTGETLLFVSTKSREEFYFESDLEAAVEAGKLALHVTLSREDSAAAAERGEQLVWTRRPRAHIDGAIAADPEMQARLWELMRSEAEGGQGAYFYVCGRAGFSHSVLTALTAVAERFVGGSGGEAREQARAALRGLFAEGRFMQDVFSTWVPHDAPGVLGGGVHDTSDVALHTLPETGQWLIVNGAVYDMTEFIHLHPGGPRIITENVGMDATPEWEAVLHHQNSEIDAMLAMYKIGSIRRLDFGDEWGVALVPKVGMSVVSLHDLYRSWVQFMHLLTEMGNALNNDWGYMSRPLTRDDDPDSLTALKLQCAANTHQRFLINYYDAALGDDVLNLWALTRSLCAPPDFARSLHAAITAATETTDAETLRRFSHEMLTLYKRIDGDAGTAADATLLKLRRLCRFVERQDKAFLAEMREIARTGVIVFEKLESRTKSDGGDRLIATLDRVPDVVRRWHADFVAGLAELDWLPRVEAAEL